MLAHRSSVSSILGALSRVLLPVLSLVVWGLVAFSAVSWGLRWSAIGQSPSSNTAAQALPEFNGSVAARSLGAESDPPVAAVSLASRLQLLGVLAGDVSQGAALIAVDGNPAKPYRVGAVVVDDLVLQSAQGRRISLGAAIDAPQTLVMELPAKN